MVKQTPEMLQVNGECSNFDFPSLLNTSHNTTPAFLIRPKKSVSAYLQEKPGLNICKAVMYMSYLRPKNMHYIKRTKIPKIKNLWQLYINILYKYTFYKIFS